MVSTNTQPGAIHSRRDLQLNSAAFVVGIGLLVKV